MNTSEILWACRRHWRVIVVALALALAAGWLTTPSQSSVAQQHREEVSYRATNTLLAGGSSDTLGRLAFRATVGEVPASVRKSLGLSPVSSDDPS